MSLQKFGRYINDRLALFVGIGLIISVHWGWYKLQQVPYLVSESEKKDLPIFTAAKMLHRSVMDGIGSLTDAKPTEEEAQKTN